MEVKQEYEIDKDSYYKAKKFIIKIFPENIDKVDSMEPRDRDQFINDAIEVYLDRYKLYRKQLDLVTKIKKMVIYSVCSLVILALLGGILRFALVYSNAVDNEMKNNFERLFNHYDKD